MKLAFYKSKQHLFNRAVAWWTGGPYSHVETVFGEEVEGKFSCGSASHRDGGVRIKVMSLPADKWDVIDVETDKERIEVYNWFVEHSRQPYDHLGLFGFIWHRGMQDPKKWFCSEACAAALGMKDPWRYDPNTLFSVVTSRG